MRFRRRKPYIESRHYAELVARENERLRGEIQSWETFAAGCHRREMEAREASRLTVELGEPYLLLPSEESPPCP